MSFRGRSSHLGDVFEVDQRGICVVEANGVRLIRSDKYGYLHQDPIPDEGDISQLYKKSFWKEHQDFLETERKTQWYWREIYYDWLDRIPGENKYHLTWLDVGCGQGFLVHWLRIKDVWAWGMDPSEDAKADLRMEFSSEKTVDLVQQFAPDVLSAILVLEHVRDPEVFIQSVHKCLLDQEGYFLVKVPNDFSPVQMELMDKFGAYWMDPVHINYFNYSNLSKLLIENGFKIVDHWYTFPMEIFLKLGINYVKYPRLGTFVHYTRMRLEYLLGYRGRNYLRRRNSGRELLVLAQAVTR